METLGSRNPSNKHVRWLFNTRGRGAPRRGFSGYLLISVLGVVGALVLLALGALLHAHAAALRMSALAWFAIFGAVRITRFWRQ